MAVARSKIAGPSGRRSAEAGSTTAESDGPVPLGRTATLRVAVVGAGYVADFHLEALAEVSGVEVVAVCDPDQARARAVARKWRVPNVVTAVDELGPSAVDLAHVLVPPDRHLAVTRRLLELGIGVFLEKPMVLNSGEALELQREADRRGLPLGVNHNNLLHPAFVRVLGRVREGRIGGVEHVQVCWSVSLPQLDRGDVSHWMFRSPENIVFEQAVHPLSLLHALIGPVRSATTVILGSRELRPGQVFHERWSTSARGEGGTAEIHLAFGRSFQRATVQVLGTDGWVEADLLHNLLTFEEKAASLDFWNSFLAGWRRSRSAGRDALAGLLRYGRFTLGLGCREDAYFAGMRGSVHAFYRAVRTGTAPLIDGRQAAEVLGWCEAIVAGVTDRRPVADRRSATVPLGKGPARPGEVLVLGATGFIGRRLVERLVTAGIPVTALARRAAGLPRQVEAAAVGGRLRLALGSLSDRRALAAALEGIRVVLHLATGSGSTWGEVESTMVGGTVALAEAALAAGVERFVYVSSIAAVYAGPDCGTDLIEDSLDTDPLPEQRDLYSRGKIATERALLALSRERGLPLVIARPGVVMGEGTPMQHPGLGYWIQDNHCVGWGRGDRPLPLVWVDDVADALVRIATHKGKDLEGRALNLCADPGLSAAEVVAELRRATGRSLHFHPRRLWLSQTFEVGKWLVKLAGRRPDRQFPAYRDLKARALAPRFSSRTAREVLGWRPVEEREAFVERALRVYGGRPAPEPNAPAPRAAAG